MAWIFLIVAGLLETAWAAGLKSVAASFSLRLFLATMFVMALSLGTLALAMRTLPLGVAYPIWTGIGSVGAVVVGVVVFRQEAGMFTFAGIALLVLGMYLISLEA